MITVIEFRTRFPEFTNNTLYPDARIQLFIDDTVTLYLGSDEQRWGGKYNIAQAYLTAHLLTVGTNSQAGDSGSKAGPISSKSAGGVSVTRAVVSKDRSEQDELFSTTIYGQQFMNIRNTCFAGILSTGCI